MRNCKGNRKKEEGYSRRIEEWVNVCWRWIDRQIYRQVDVYIGRYVDRQMKQVQPTARKSLVVTVSTYVSLCVCGDRQVDEKGTTYIEKESHEELPAPT